jgi:hypothetical protein
MRSVQPGALEWARAVDYLKQCQNPFTTDVATAMRWRFLPQLLLYPLHLGTFGCLLVPWLGVVALTLGCAYVFLGVAGLSKWQTLGGLVLVTTTSPVLCATGWLGINDAWVIGALMLVAFTKGPTWLVLAPLVAPWIDERFWFGLPSALLVRGLQAERWPSRREWTCLLVSALPFLLIRVWGLRRGQSDPSVAFIQDYRSAMLPMLLKSPLGFWMGGRWAFLPVVLAWDAIAQRWGWRLAGLAVASLAGPILLLACLASDTMRSIGIMLPWVVYGYIALVRRTPVLRWALGLAALQLLTPATQVTSDKLPRIDPLPVELYRLIRPPV